MMMTLKYQIHQGLNKAFTTLDISILHSAIYHRALIHPWWSISLLCLIPRKQIHILTKCLFLFVEVVKVQEQNGMELSFAEKRLYGTIEQVADESFGLNSGYVKSYTANYNCRKCLLKRCENDLHAMIHIKFMNRYKLLRMCKFLFWSQTQ